MNPRTVCAVCGVKSSLICSKCKVKYYCSREHQKTHWTKHKEECLPISLKMDTDIRKKVYVAKNDIKEGQVIFTSRPFMIFPFVPINVYMDNQAKRHNVKVCMGCCQEIHQEEVQVAEGLGYYTPVPECSVCKWPVCNKICAENPFHANLECKILAKRLEGKCTVHFFDDTGIPYNRSCLLRALLMKDVFPEKWQMLLEMPIHNLTANPNTSLEQMKLQATISFIRDECKQHQFDTDFISKFYKVLQANLTFDRRLPFCAKLSNSNQFISEGCLYNIASNYVCSIDDPESSTLEKVERHYWALSDIAKGEALKIPILAICETSGTFLRKQSLLQVRGISCSCKLCKDPTELGTYMSAVRCTVCKPKYGKELTDEFNPNLGYMLPVNPLCLNSPWKCCKCEKQVKPQEINRKIKDLENKFRQMDIQWAGSVHQIMVDGFELNIPSNGNLTVDQLSSINNSVNIIPNTILPKLAEMMVKHEGQLYRNHYILIREQKSYVDYLFFYLCLNRSEPFVPSIVTLGAACKYLFGAGHKFAAPSSAKWLELNNELQKKSTELLEVYRKIYADSSMLSGRVFLYLAFSKLMILKSNAVLHRDYAKFLEEVNECNYFKRKADRCHRNGMGQNLPGTDMFVNALELMDSVDSDKNTDTFAIFKKLLS